MREKGVERGVEKCGLRPQLAGRPSPAESNMGNRTTAPWGERAIVPQASCLHRRGEEVTHDVSVSSCGHHDRRRAEPAPSIGYA